TYFDPITLRLQETPKQYRLETVVLPLIDNSVYTDLARALGGKPEPLDELLVPDKNLMSVLFRLDLKKQLLGDRDASEDDDEKARKELADDLGLSAKDLEGFSLRKLLSQGLG